MKQILGYLLGFTIFIAGIPALMWLETDFGQEYLEYKKMVRRFL